MISPVFGDWMFMTCISVFNFSISLIALWIFPIWYGLLTFQGTIVESFQRSTTREFLHSSFSPDLPALDTQVPWSVVFFLIIHAHQTSDALVGPIMHWISFTLCTFMLITFFIYHLEYSFIPRTSAFSLSYLIDSLVCNLARCTACR